MYKIYILVLLLIIIYIYYKSSNNLSFRIYHNYLDKRKSKKLREMKYLEFSIIGINSPFNNYLKSNELTLLSYIWFKNITYILEEIIYNQVKGDILEAGNWRGGGMLYAKGILYANDIEDKEIWMFDTFS